MRPDEWEQTYTEFVLARQTHLRRLAYAICGDWDTADVMLQAALVKLYVVWPAVRRDGTEDAHARRLVIRTPFDLASTTAASGRSRVVEVLQSLPLDERKAVLLRQWLEVSEEETAEDLGVSVATARLLATRGRAALADVVVRESP
jgi:DNA-directed RNA polymerase specialized sigma24 family protein